MTGKQAMRFLPKQLSDYFTMLQVKKENTAPNVLQKSFKDFYRTELNGKELKFLLAVYNGKVTEVERFLKNDILENAQDELHSNALLKEAVDTSSFFSHCSIFTSRYSEILGLLEKNRPDCILRTPPTRSSQKPP